MSELGDRLRDLAKSVDEAGNLKGIIVLMTGPLQFEIGSTLNIDYRIIAHSLLLSLKQSIDNVDLGMLQ